MSTGGLTGGLYKPLTDQEIETVHQKALDILEQVGIGYEDDLEALDMLIGAGCEIDRHAGRVYIPRDIVAETVAKAPQEFTLYSRDGKNDLHLGQDRVYAGTGGTTVQILDLDTGKIRGTRLADQYHIAKLVDTLDNIHFYQSAVAPLDIPTERYDPNILFAAMMGTRKHIMFGCNFRAGLVEAFNMATLVVGNDAVLRKEPIFSISACAIISPLKFCSQSVANVHRRPHSAYPPLLRQHP